MQSENEAEMSWIGRRIAHYLRRSAHSSRSCALLVAGLLAGAGPAWGEPRATRVPTDATLSVLIQQSLAARPELSRAEATVRANQERAPQVRALPDPMLQVGIQNDGFSSIEIGRMGTSYVSVMASQTFPWPGKLELQAHFAELSVLEARNGLARARLSTEADVRRAYLALLLARDRLALLDQVSSVWQSALAIARVQYQSGAGSQSDLFRAELALLRLKQRRIALFADETSRVQALNRLRNHPLNEPIATIQHLQELPPLDSQRSAFSAERALARSPELGSARLGIARASKSAAIAELSYYPDLTLAAGVMFRGQLPPMWQVTVAGPVPIFSGAKRNGAVTESRAWGSAAERQVAELEQLLRLRSKERETAFAAVSESVAVYQQGLLLESKASAESALIQYRVGKLPFAAVLEANASYLADQESVLDAIATAHEILIAEAEISLAPTPMPSVGDAPAGMPGAAATAMRGTSESSSAGNSSPTAPGGAPSGM